MIVKCKQFIFYQFFTNQERNLMRTPEHIQILSVRIPDTLKKQVNQGEKRKGITVNAFISNLLSDYFEKKELTAELADLRERLLRVESAVFGTESTN